MTAPAAVSGKTARTAAVQAYMLSLVTPDSEQARRIRALITELDDISLDRQMAGHMAPETTRGWMNELATEERATWRALRATATPQEQEVEAA